LLLHNTANTELKKYLIVIIFFAVGLAVVSIGSGAWSRQPQQPSNITTFPSHSQQSSFYTATTNNGIATITEILVNTDIQFPIGDRTILPTSLANAVQIYAAIVLLCLGMLLVLLSSSRRA